MAPSDSDATQYDPEISLFLLLCREHEQLIEGLMEECRSIVPSEPFIPHMTMYFGSGAPSGGIRSLVDSVAASTGPIAQPIVGIGGEDRFWRASYIALSGGQPIDNLNAMLRREIVNYGEYSHFPHVSLVYGTQVTPEHRSQIKEHVARRLRDARVETLVFDRVAMFQRHSPQGVWEDVSRWREVYAATLRGEG